MQLFLEHKARWRRAEDMCKAISPLRKIVCICYKQSLVDSHQIWLHGEKGFFCGNKVSHRP